MAQQTAESCVSANRGVGKSRSRLSRELQVRRREYSPTLGRFIERDPIGFEAGDNNWYRFVANEPTQKTDSSGLVAPDRPIDPEKDVRTYNCAGLAFRDYKYWNKTDVQKKLAGCKEGDLKKPCPRGLELKVIYYDITGLNFFKDGKVIVTRNIDDFHIVGMVGEGDRCVSKNGPSPIEGPGPIDSFSPNQPFPPPKLPEGVTLEPVFTTKVYCCPNK
ncbi:MAG: hypothetical protein EBT03_10110 [Betaproteobacteria bacterium]|nr:hypothetical protein [Betaproteobacteria bacterium]NCA17385.1 hypothetical protein [Betaproteobacteria bacterium]